MSTNVETVLDRLRTAQSQYRRRDLQQQLDSLAATLGDLYLTKVLYETLLDISIEIDEDLQANIREIQANLEQGDTEAVANQVERLEEQITEFETKIDKQISEPLGTHRSNVESMKRLNQKLSVIETEQLAGLKTVLEPGDVLSRIEFESDADFQTKIETAEEVVADYRATYESARTELFETYLETDYGEKVTEMMSDDPPVLESFEPEELEHLYNSDLTPFIELRFG